MRLHRTTIQASDVPVATFLPWDDLYLEFQGSGEHSSQSAGIIPARRSWILAETNVHIFVI